MNKIIIINYFYLGIPFAEPPVNKNRFKKPIKVSSWSNIKDGTNWPNVCEQEVKTFLAKGQSLSEDCLYLNIFVSAKSYMKYRKNKCSKKPILVFIHGGQFDSGSSISYEPSINVALSDIIYITIQYRLGPFGFMHLAGTKVSGNQAFLDQHLALKWVNLIYLL